MLKHLIICLTQKKWATHILGMYIKFVTKNYLFLFDNKDTSYTAVSFPRIFPNDLLKMFRKQKEWLLL